MSKIHCFTSREPKNRRHNPYVRTIQRIQRFSSQIPLKSLKSQAIRTAYCLHYCLLCSLYALRINYALYSTARFETNIG